MKKISLLLLALLSIPVLSSCEKDKLPEVHGDYENGIYIVNEGSFGQGNASISFLNADASTVTNMVYKNVNSHDLGDQAQSIAFTDDNAYIVVTASNKIEVVEKDNMKKVVTMASHLTNPRYMQPVDNNLAYVTCWGDPFDVTDDYIAIINTASNTYTSEFSVPLGPEKMVANDNYIFVAHQGAYGTNNIISVIDLNNRQISNTINVGDRPNSMIIKDGYLWVLCGGKPSYTHDETPGHLYKIDINNGFNTVMILDFATTQHPQFLTEDGNNLYYYVDGKFYEMDAAGTTALPTTEIITYPTAYNAKANDGKLYVTDADAPNYSAEGKIIVYDLSTKAEITRKTVGLFPGDIGFNLK